MPKGLERRHVGSSLHFITLSCHRNAYVLSSTEAKTTFLRILEETREKYQFLVIGYVLMDNHVHLLISKPEISTPATVMQVIKQRFSCTRSEEFVWEKRYYDFNVWSVDKRIEKLRYMHRNPVQAGIVERPEDYPWSSFRVYAFQEPGPVLVTDITRW